MTEKLNYLEILLKDPLYSEYELSELKLEEILNILFFNKESYLANKLKTVDSYCTVCKKETTFISKETNRNILSNVITEAGYYSGGDGNIESLIEELQKEGTFQRDFQCPRPESDSSHDQIYLFRVQNTKLIKIGQNPSIADLSKKDIEKYRTLKENIYQELNRAIGLSSHGVGVGSFVYLRRIIEKHIVASKLNELLKEEKITLEEISQTDFKGKIDLAKDKLPDFLVNNKKIYSILSKGLHELEEKECKEYFPILRSAIEIILDEEIEKIERDKKNKLISEKLNKIK